MRKFKFSKLIRDKIADAIVKAGGKVNQRILDDKEYIEELKKKLVEEARELENAPQEDLLEEICDVQEIIDYLVEVLQSSQKEIERIRKQKEEKAGSFKRRIYVETVEVPDDYQWIPHYLSDPERYPEIK